MEANKMRIETFFALKGESTEKFLKLLEGREQCQE